MDLRLLFGSGLLAVGRLSVAVALPSGRCRAVVDGCQHALWTLLFDAVWGLLEAVWWQFGAV
eukprot:2784091-Lingulodinium_polyedra.AAC.1